MHSRDQKIHNTDSVRKDVNIFLHNYFKLQRTRSAYMHADYGFLWQSLHDLHKASGKRMRPYLFFLAYESLGGMDYKKVVPVGVALELLHSAMLIHDDIIDRDYSRHGTDNIMGMYRKRYSQLDSTKYDLDHFSNSAAILAGDLMLSEAYQQILRSDIEADKQLQAIKLIGDAVFAVVGGELLDTEAVLYDSEHSDCLKIAENKTAFYSCTTPLLLGAMLADADDTTISTLNIIGTALGIAFQLADDLLGVFGVPEQTGKTVLGDIREGKQTYLLQRTLQLASHEQKVQLNAIVGNPDCDKEMAKKAQKIMESCGAKSDLEQLIQNYAKKAEIAVDSLDVSESAKAQFKALISKSAWRNS